jgi:hypothetical protein
MSSKYDVGLMWAKAINIWGQLSAISGILTTMMTIGIFYTTTLQPSFHVPLWLYILVIIFGVVVWTGFVIKYGISGYYRFMSNQSEISETNRKVTLIMRHFKIEDDDRQN